MVRGKVPVAAVLLAVSVRTLVLVVLAGLNVEAVTPLGRPETDSATLPVKPFCGVTVMVLVPLPPCVRVYGDAERLKFGAGLTVSVKLCVAFGSVPFAAVTVIGNAPLAVGVPLSTPAVLNVTPPGSAPVSLNVGAGVPVAVTVNVPAVPTVKVVLVELVIDGATVGGGGISVSVDWYMPVSVGTGAMRGLTASPVR